MITYTPFNPINHNPNLLINGDFKVWQRGTSFSGLTPNNLPYTADRWRVYCRAGSCSVNKVDDGMQITKDGEPGNVTLLYTFEQDDYAKIKDKSFVVTACINGVTEKTFIILPDNVEWVANKRFWLNIEFQADETRTINWVKAELGSIPTPFSPRPYAEELQLCQRYYLPVVTGSSYNGLLWGTGLSGYTYNSGSDYYAEMYVPLPVPMRGRPSIANLALSNVGIIVNGQHVSPSSLTDVTVAQSSDKTVILHIPIPSTAPMKYACGFNLYGRLALDAEIY